MIPDRNGFHHPLRGHTPNGVSSRRAEIPKSKSKKAASRPQTRDEVPDLPLVAEDALSFRVIADDQDGLARQKTDTAAVAEGFRAAFAGVWRKIPPADRQRMLAYWRRGGDSLSRDRSARDEKPAPLIRVVGGSEPPDDVIARCGMEISLPASLVGQPFKLVGEVARALAGVHRYVSREHWGLILAVIEEPLDLWEREQGADVDDDRRDKKLDELEAEYLRRFTARIDQIIGAWRIEASRGE
jgi:hypothetical protein